MRTQWPDLNNEVSLPPGKSCEGGGFRKPGEYSAGSEGQVASFHLDGL